MAAESQAEHQVPFWNHVLKTPEREALTVRQVSERFRVYGRQLHVESIQIYVIEAQVWGGPRATKHTKSPPEEEAGLTTELP